MSRRIDDSSPPTWNPTNTEHLCEDKTWQPGKSQDCEKCHKVKFKIGTFIQGARVPDKG